MTTNDAAPVTLLPCPFCGGNASFEHLVDTRWSVGCSDIDGECMGYQSLQTFPRKADAIAAWNHRIAATEPAGDLERAAIVAWLRQWAVNIDAESGPTPMLREVTSGIARFVRIGADAIEKGRHLDQRWQGVGEG